MQDMNRSLALALALAEVCRFRCEVASVSGRRAPQIKPLLAAALGMSVDDFNATLPAWGRNRSLEADDYATLAGELYEGAFQLDPHHTLERLDLVRAKLARKAAALEEG